MTVRPRPMPSRCRAMQCQAHAVPRHPSFADAVRPYAPPEQRLALPQLGRARLCRCVAVRCGSRAALRLSLPMPSEPMRCHSDALRGDAMPLRRCARRHAAVPTRFDAFQSRRPASPRCAVALRFHPVRCPRPAAQTKADAVPCRAKPLLCPPKPLPCLALRLLAVAPPCLAHLRRYNPVLCPRSAVHIVAGPSRCMPAHFSAVAVIRCRTASRRSRRRRCRRTALSLNFAIAPCRGARRSPATP